MSQIVVPAAARSVITATPRTTFQVGTYTALTDAFTKTLDLNDHVNYWLVSADLAQPKKVYSRSTTIRAAGERIANWNYQNRHVRVVVQLLYESGTQALLAAVRSLLSAIENPPYRLAFAAPNSTVLTYADVVAVSHTIPYDAKSILAETITKITIDFECAPGFSGDRITLSNLAVNPGFEAPSGPAVTVFSDPFATTNAYSVVSGTAPSVASNVMTIPTAGIVQFGSPAWGAINTWQARFQWVTSLNATFALHYTDFNNRIQAVANGATLVLGEVASGTFTSLASVTATLTNGNWYWIKATQFPAAPGTAPYIQATLYADSAGAIGGQVAAAGPVATVNATTALAGKPALYADSAALAVGGAFANVHTVSLFGPGGWSTSDFSGVSAYAWEQSTANTYGGGAVTSYGAARIDAPPAGAWNAIWKSYNAGAPGGTSAMPVSAAGNVIAASVWTRSSGLSASAIIALYVVEYDVNGTFLRQTDVASLTGNQTAWTHLSGTLTTGASCAYVAIWLNPLDGTAGASANATIWFDNAQCYNQTTTGQTVMPYCELRFPQSPAQLLVTGLQGDMVAPAFTALGAYKPTFGTQHTIYAWLGSKASPGAAAQLVGASLIGPASTAPTPILDSSQWGGFYLNDTDVMAPGAYYTTFYAFSASPAALAGIYHVFERLWTTNANHAAISAQATVAISTDQFDQSGPTYTKRRALVQDAAVYPLVASSNWIVSDGGQVIIPPFGQDALLDNTQNYLTPAIWWTDPNGNSYSYRHTWQALLPIDGGVLIATLVNGTSSNPTASPWKWLYSDGLAQSLGLAATWHYSFEATSLANPGGGIGGAGTTNSASPSVNPVADAYLLLDPSQSCNGVSGVAQLVGIMTDDNSLGTILPLYAEIQYVPLYLYPREQ